MAILIKCRNGVVPSVALIFSFIITNLAFAETKVFVEEYTYQASEYDSKVSCRVLALEQVKRLLLEKLGTYLESETEVKTFQLTKDQIVILTGGIVSSEILDEKWDGKTYYLKAKIAADPKEIIKSIDLLRLDRQKTKELEETRKKADEALREVERLKKQLEISKVGKTEQDQYTNAVNRVSAKDWYLRGQALVKANKAQKAREAFTKAIELDPKYAVAYCDRGYAYFILGDNQQAIKDYDRAIQLNPQAAIFYYYRGVYYGKLGNYQQAIRDYDRAIELDPIAPYYMNRAASYFELGNYQRAISDYDKAFELGMDGALVYSSRGFANLKLDNKRQAIKDYDKAIELDPNNVDAYGWRGLVYFILGDYQQAIKDYDKAIQLKPEHSSYYYGRALAYGKLGDNGQAIKDYQIAAKLGNKKAQDYLRSKGINW